MTKSNQVKPNIIEVLTTLNLTPTRTDFERINTKIIFATVVELSDKKKIDRNEMEKIILIDVPSSIYSELRTIFVSLFENCGFKDVKISENVDFKKLYEMTRAQ